MAALGGLVVREERRCDRAFFHGERLAMVDFLSETGGVEHMRKVPNAEFATWKIEGEGRVGYGLLKRGMGEGLAGSGRRDVDENRASLRWGRGPDSGEWLRVWVVQLLVLNWMHRTRLRDGIGYRGALVEALDTARTVEAAETDADWGRGRPAGYEAEVVRAAWRVALGGLMGCRRSGYLERRGSGWGRGSWGCIAHVYAGLCSAVVGRSGRGGGERLRQELV